MPRTDDRLYLEAICSNASVALFIMDECQQCVFMNPAAEELTGYSFAEVQGKALHEVIHHTRPDGRPYPLDECPIDRAFPSNNREQGEEIFIHKDGRFYDVGFTASPIREQGRIVGTIIEVQEITEQKRLREQLHRTAAELLESGRRKDEFLALMAHELRNPMAPLRSGVELLRHQGAHSDTRQRVVEMMARQMHHLARLVDDLLDLSRINQGKLELRLEPVDIRTLVTEVVHTVTGTERQRVSVEMVEGPLEIAGDHVRIFQTLSNLLSNALKFTPPSGRVWVCVQRAPEKLRIIVRDSGEGIAAGQLVRIFEMFHQASSDVEGGLGLGLTIARSLVELHGGTVEAFSEGPGLGSEFVVTLPTNLDSLVAMHGKAEMAAGCQGSSVLVVDDNKDAADSLAMLLDTLGASVRTTYDGQSALNELEQSVPDVVLMDIGMPRLDGYEVARRIRARHTTKQPRLIAVTGWGQHADRAQAKAAGFDWHLTKPVSLEDLKRAVAPSRRLNPPN